MLLGHWLEIGAVTGARDALGQLARLLPGSAALVKPGRSNKVPHPWPRVIWCWSSMGRVPADGRVEECESHVNEARLTVESSPVLKAPGDHVTAGTQDEMGSLRVRIDKAGEDIILAGILRLVEQVASSRSRAQALADRAAFWLVVAVAWGLAPVPAAFVWERVVTVLVAVPSRRAWPVPSLRIPGHPPPPGSL